MSEQQDDSGQGTSRPPPAQRPRREDGSFMTNKEYDEYIRSQRLEAAETRNKDSMKHLEDSNKALMRGTNFTEDYFKGMDSLAINKFLTNYHSRQEKAGSQPPASNTPILGTPIGSGRRKQAIDDFVNIDPKKQQISFEAPGSLVFATHDNIKEAKKQWLEAR